MKDGISKVRGKTLENYIRAGHVPKEGSLGLISQFPSLRKYLTVVSELDSM